MTANPHVNRNLTFRKKGRRIDILPQQIKNIVICKYHFCIIYIIDVKPCPLFSI
jgi:hypothetical protein